MAQFLLYKDDEILKTFTSLELPVIIGRLPENGIAIPSMDISRRHARIAKNNKGSYELTDLNSLNGTFVNTKKITGTIVLAPGDRILLGTHILVFEATPSALAQKNETATLLSDVIGEPSPTSSLPDLIAGAIQTKTVFQSNPVLIETNRHLVYKIDKDTISLGNSEADDIFVDGPFLEAEYVVLERKDDGVWLTTKKFFGMAKLRINGKKASSQCLSHKDRLEIGTSTFRYMENG